MPKSQNGRIEAKRLTWYVVNLNNRRLRKDKSLQEHFNKLDINLNDIDYFEQAGTPCKSYDIIIKFTNGTIKTIEHKGITKTSSKNITNEDERPWSQTPQLVNSTYKNSDFSIKYSKCWHEKIHDIKKQFPTLPNKPTYEEFEKDVTSFGVKTYWGKELKRLVSEDPDKKKWLDTFVDKTFKDFWSNVLNYPSNLAYAEENILNEMNNKLIEKNFWLNAYYESDRHIEPLVESWYITPTILCLTCEIFNENEKKKTFNKIKI